MAKMKLVVIGAGPGGYAAAIRAAQLGAEVTLIEKDQPGGTCLNRGCIPSKIMKRSAEAAQSVREAALFGVLADTPSFKFSMAVLRARQKKIVEGQIMGLVRHFKALGINLVKGSARVLKAGTVTVAKAEGPAENFAYDNLLLATGSEPADLPGLSIDGNKIISSDQALWMEERPQTMLVVGGGVIGCELAQIFHSFGTEVTIVEALDRILPLPSLDEEISKHFMRYLKKTKLPFLTGTTLAGVKEAAGGVTAVLAPLGAAGETRQAQFEKILLSVGRRPVLDRPELQTLGVTFAKQGWVEAGPDLRTKSPNIWAIGDCLGPGRIMLAHVATAEGLAAAENMFGGQRTVNYEQAPSAVFTSPEIASVGLTLAQAEHRPGGGKAYDFLFRQLGKAQAMGEIDGLVRLIVGPDDQVLGGHIMGPGATNLIAEVAVAVTNGLKAENLAATIHAHPTLSEGIWEAALLAAGRPLHG